jgi:hypothetical protein
MNLLKIFSLNDSGQNTRKKVLFLIFGLIILIFDCILLFNIPSEYYSTRKLISGILTLGAGYFFIMVIFTSFINPVYIIGNKFIRPLLPFVFTWGGFILYRILNRTFIAAIISSVMVFVGYIFSGILIGVENKILNYLNMIFTWCFSRVFIIVFPVIALIDIIKIIYKMIIR